MNQEAKELVRIAKTLLAKEFSSKEALLAYLKLHPKAKKENHKVVEHNESAGWRNESEYNHEGKKHGKSIDFDERGNKVNETDYKDGLAHGKETTYHPSGNLRSEVPMVDGRHHGKMIGKHPNGETAYTGEYKQGKPVGKHISYDRNGKKTDEKEY